MIGNLKQEREPGSEVFNGTRETNDAGIYRARLNGPFVRVLYLPFVATLSLNNYRTHTAISLT